MPQWLEQLLAAEPLLSVTGDGAYDTQPIYAMPIIAPAKKCADVQRQRLCTSQYSNCRIQAFGMQIMEELK